jgi:hypothetical protein
MVQEERREAFKGRRFFCFKIGTQDLEYLADDSSASKDSGTLIRGSDRPERFHGFEI